MTSNKLSLSISFIGGIIASSSITLYSINVLFTSTIVRFDICFILAPFCFINRLLLILFIVLTLSTCFMLYFINSTVFIHDIWFILVNYFMLSTFFLNSTVFMLDSRFVPFDMGDPFSFTIVRLDISFILSFRT